MVRCHRDDIYQKMVNLTSDALMDWDEPDTNVPSTVLGAAEGLGTNNLDEIELTGAPLDRVKRRFRRQNHVLQGKFPNVNVVMGSTCYEAGCRAIVRMQLDISERSIANYIRQLTAISK